MPNPCPHWPFYISDHYRLGVFGKVSVEASGLYLRLIPIGWDSTRCGYLVDMHGKALPLAGLANQCGLELGQLDALVGELLQCGAVQKTQDNCLKITLMAQERNSVTAHKRELLRQRVARHRYRKKVETACNANQRYTDNDIDNDNYNKALVDNNGITTVNVSPARELADSLLLSANSRGNNGHISVNCNKLPKVSNDFQQTFDFEAELRSMVSKLLRIYPKIGNEKVAGDAIRLALHKIKFADLEIATQRFADSVAGKEKHYLTAPEKWFSQGMFQDYLGERWESFEKAHVAETAKRSGKVIYEPEDITALSWLEMDKLIGEMYDRCAAETQFEDELRLLSSPTRTTEENIAFVHKMRAEAKRDTPEEIKQYIHNYRTKLLKESMAKKGIVVLPQPGRKKAIKCAN